MSSGVELRLCRCAVSSPELSRRGDISAFLGVCKGARKENDTAGLESFELIFKLAAWFYSSTMKTNNEQFTKCIV